MASFQHSPRRLVGRLGTAAALARQGSLPHLLGNIIPLVDKAAIPAGEGFQQFEVSVTRASVSQRGRLTTASPRFPGHGQSQSASRSRPRPQSAPSFGGRP
ncbi:hypothetical protein P7K49_029731 [Saguinus oedipus]|uniref:Uncharacterized protein n=1 Tax=Saguinus oedipus TaxID=9490 RepID=A0ABQ9UA19_SAGOE|nr:hypothetical protein P7K49_029731 [Saguinus oedipus]